mgnify:CR=1 FL=1
MARTHVLTTLRNFFLGETTKNSHFAATKVGTLKPDCKNTLIVQNCFKSSVETGLERSKIEIFVEAFVPPIDVSDTCIYGVAAIDVHYRITAITPRPKITVICALPES